MGLLPEGYEPLEPFAADWALPTAAKRATKRGASTPEQRKAFYGAALPLAGGALTALDAKPLEALSEAEHRLLNLLLTFAHISLAVEVQGEAEEQHAVWRNRMQITRAPADLPA
jgi:hypothetical protein